MPNTPESDGLPKSVPKPAQYPNEAAADAARAVRDIIAENSPPRLPTDRALAEAKRLIARMPPREDFVANAGTIAPWMGEAVAFVTHWNSLRGLQFRQELERINTAIDFGGRSYANALAVLHQLRRDYELHDDASTSEFVDKGGVHDYFEALRAVVAEAKQDLLITDRFLDADFVRRYAPFVTKGARVRLLLQKRNDGLLQAAPLAASQHGFSIAVGAHSEVHDRYAFVDGQACYFSGASFAQGGQTGPTIVAAIVDFEELRAKYEAMWTQAGVLLA